MAPAETQDSANSRQEPTPSPSLRQPGQDESRLLGQDGQGSVRKSYDAADGGRQCCGSRDSVVSAQSDIQATKLDAKMNDKLASYQFSSTKSEPDRLVPECCGMSFPIPGVMSHGISLVIILMLAWGTLWGITGNDTLPGGPIFALLLLVPVCWLGGKVAELVRLPPLLGMLVVGFILRNVPYIDIGADLKPAWSSALRNVALVIILTRAGLGLDPQQLKKLSGVCFRLAFTPCLLEAITEGVVAHYLLDLPWLWAFMLGFVLAAVSPAVVVPSMLSLQESGFGVEKGIPTLVIAAASIDDVLAISGFGILLGVTFTTGSLVITIIQGPIEVLIGLVFGVSMGCLLWILPSQRQDDATLTRFTLLFGSGMFSLFASRAAGFPGAGALGCLILAFVAAYGWRKAGIGVADVSGVYTTLWQVFQPVLFGLIGAEVALSNIQADTLGLGLATLGAGLSVRIIASFFSVFGAGFTLKERLFIPIAWLPKATVQAAIGSVALDTARLLGTGAEDEVLGMKILTIAVLSILVTAPFGAAGIALFAPRLLQQREKTASVNDHSSGNPA